MHAMEATRRPPSTLGIRHRDNLENVVLAYFDRNRGEGLRTNDAVIKFDSEYTWMSALLKRLFDRGALLRKRDSEGFFVYWAAEQRAQA